MLDYVLWPVGKTFAKVSRVDIDLVAKRNWYVNSSGYATTGKGAQMHRILMAAELAAEGLQMCIDHANRDSLDNRRENLRVCTHAQNMRNRARLKDFSSPYKGVRLKPYGAKRKGSRWVAEIRADGIRHHLGYFKDAESAAASYNEAALRLHGEFARPNALPAKAAA